MEPLIITESNLSVAWAKAFIELMKPGKDIRHPAIVTIQGFDITGEIEDIKIKNRLNFELKKHKKNTCETVAGTIFPSSMWNPILPNDAEVLFNRYERAWPGIKICKTNRKGVYFRRLTSYQSKNECEQPAKVNQLKFIIDTYKQGNHRKSAMQAAIFDPSRDHSNAPILGFPCLQQVTFTPIGDNQLSITGFYAKQLHFEKSYGNYLGLYELGRFMAKQLGLKLTQVICIASCLERSDASKFSKNQLIPLANDLHAILTGS
jgi:thymidylate synthase